MDGLLFVIILVGLLIVVYFDSFQKMCESFTAIKIRRWRAAPPVGISPNIVSRQVSDDWWAQQYDSGIGFQLA